MKKNIIGSFVVLVLSFAYNASAQETKVMLTPLFENGSYDRSNNYEDKASGYQSTGVKSDMTQKGFVADFHGTGRWSTKLRFTSGAVDTPTYHYRLTNDQSGTMPYDQSDNAVVRFSGKSRTLEVSEEYSQGLLTYRFGIGYRLLQHTDFTTVFGEGASYSESEYNDYYVGPRIGVTVQKRFRRITPQASIDASPWIHHAGNYEFRLQNWGNSDYQESQTGKSLDLDLAVTLRLLNNLSLTGGWRYSAIRNNNPLFFSTSSNAAKTPQTDTWRGVYIGLNVGL